LLLKFYEPESGKILIDDKDSKEYGLTDLRNQMAMVPQDVLLFGGSIKENIAYGKPGASMEEIIEAAKQANAHNFIDSFPEKYETLVGERGIKLSGRTASTCGYCTCCIKKSRYSYSGRSDQFT
jgi:ABC-type multidrug transport system fused ATPase/permease subunit